MTVAADDDLVTIFERAPILADRLADRKGLDSAEIVAAARAELARMSEAERIAVLNAHPRIGAAAATLSELSRREQAGDTNAATSAELARLNDAYERRFGFRFVVFVRGRSRPEIVGVLRRRLTRSREEELATGIEEFLAITRDRLLRGRR